MTYTRTFLGSAGGSSSGLTATVHQVAHGFTVGQVLRNSGGTYVLAKADTAANADVVGIVSAVAGADDFTLSAGGRVTGLSGLTAGTDYFLSASTSGALTATEPSTAGQVSKPLLIADSTTSGLFANMRGIVIPGASAPVTGGLLRSGSLAETMPRALASNAASAAMTSGTVYGVAIWLTAGQSITHITFSTGTTALATGTHQIFGLYDGSLNLLATTTDDTSTAWAASSLKTLALSSPASYTVPTSGWYNLALLVAATTMPNLATAGGMATGPSVSPYVSAKYNTGASALPSTLTFSAVNAPTPWADVS